MAAYVIELGQRGRSATGRGNSVNGPGPRTEQNHAVLVPSAAQRQSSRHLANGLARASAHRNFLDPPVRKETDGRAIRRGRNTATRRSHPRISSGRDGGDVASPPAGNAV